MGVNENETEHVDRELAEEEAEQFIEDFKRLNARPASILEVGGFRPTGNPLVTNIGGLPVMHPDESWPTDYAGRPMQFIVQLNLTEAPFVPEILKDVALITVFVADDCIQRGFSPGSWELRAYKDLTSLVPAVTPSQPWHWVRGFECRWQEITDYPSYDDSELKLPNGYSLEDDLPEEMHGLNVRRSKIGGFASTIQHEVEFVPAVKTADGWERGENPPFVLQINSEEKSRLMWADNGTLYIGRTPGIDQWFASCQFY